MFFTLKINRGIVSFLSQCINWPQQKTVITAHSLANDILMCLRPHQSIKFTGPGIENKITGQKKRHHLAPIKNNKRIFISVICLMFVSQGMAQTEGYFDLKPFYSVYTLKKINTQWSADFYGLLATKSFHHDFWLSQFDISIHYRIKKVFTLSLGYGQCHYNYKNKPWWEKHYPNIRPGILGTAIFHCISGNISRTDQLGTKIDINNGISLQNYYPGFEKYQTRAQYSIKLSYRKRDLPFMLRPFVQGTLYYYLNGTHTNYYDKEYNIVKKAPPNGLHRYRIKAGINFAPVQNKLKMYLVFYYAINREFNTNGPGNNINVTRPSAPGSEMYTTYPFNNFDIVGLQLNYFW